MKKIWENIITVILAIITFAMIIAYILFEIYLWKEYGGKPINEIPQWVLCLMWGK